MLYLQAVSTRQGAGSRWLSPPLLLGFGVVAAARLLTLPHSLWEGDEVLFVKGVELFDPIHHQPHPPGYPLLIGLGKLLNLLLHDPFASLVTLSVISSLVGYLALVDAFRRIAPATATLGSTESVAIAGAVLFHLSPAMLVYGPLALSDPPALMFLSLALAAAARLRERASLLAAASLGVSTSAAIGCRPQLAVAVLPMLAVALWTARRPRATGAIVSIVAFAVMSLLWFVPLVVAVGGPAGLAPFLAKQAGLVVRYDTGASRTGNSTMWVATRFLAHPWGPRWTSLPVLFLAAVGGWALSAASWAKRAAVLPLAVLCGVDLVFALAVMNPFDAVRYALPSLLGVAFAAALGAGVLVQTLAQRGRPVPVQGAVLTVFAVFAATALLAAGFAIYTRPLLVTRTTADSPPVQAARWIERSIPQGAALLVDKEMAPYTSYLLRNWVLRPADPGLTAADEFSPGTPVYVLAAEESTWPGAVSFRWPETDAASKLTRGMTRVVSVSRIPEAGRYAAIRGVSGFEPGISRPAFRWLGPDAAIRLAAGPPQPPGTLAVTLGLPGYAPRPSTVVNVSVNGSAPSAVSVPRGGSRTVVLPVRPGAAEVTFGSPASFVPAEVGLGQDRRHLAVQLLGVERHAS
jgi:hypothetical protein